MKKKLRLISIFLFVLLAAASLFAGCDSGRAVEEGKVPLDIYMQQGNQYSGVTEPNRVWLKIEEDTGVQTSFEGPTAEYHAQPLVGTMMDIARGRSEVDIIWMQPEQTGTGYSDWVKEGLFYNMDTLLAMNPGEYPYIEMLFQTDLYKSLSWEGAHTMVPWLTTNNIYGIYYRGDWLAKIGYYEKDEQGNPVLDEKGRLIPVAPKTISEFADVMQKFSDPSYNLNPGTKTYGMSPHQEPFAMNLLYHAFGVVEDFSLDENGNVIYSYMQDEYKTFLKWMNSMYKAGWIEPQFNTNSGVKDRDLFKKGTVGILITDVEQHVKWVLSEMPEAVNESSEVSQTIVMGAPLLGDGTNGSVEGLQGSSTRGSWWGGFSIAKTCEEPEAAMRYLNYLISPEGSKVNRYGVEGIHYTEDENGRIITNDEERGKRGDRCFSESIGKDGVRAYNGCYLIGFNQQGGVMDWSKFETEKRVIVSNDPAVLDYQFRDLIEDAAELNVPYYDALPETLIFDSATTLLVDKIKARAQEFYLPAVIQYSEADIDARWNEMIAACSDLGWAAAQQGILASAREFGYVQ